MSHLASLASAGGKRTADGQPAAKRMKTEAQKAVGEPYYSTLLWLLSQMREEAVKQRSAGQAAAGLEIEIRVGMIVQNKRRLRAQVTAPEAKVLVYESGQSGRHFVAGVDEPFLEDMKKALAEKNFKPAQQPPQRLLLDGNGRRLEVETSSGNGGTKFKAMRGSVAAETKSRIYRKDVALLSHGYDIRVDAAYETLEESRGQEANTEVTLDGKTWTQMRLKKRLRYKQEQSSSSNSSNASSWKVDITEVEATQVGILGQEERSRELEVEIELEAAAGQEWLSKSAEDAVAVTNRLTNELMTILNICVPCDTMAFATAADEAAASLGEPCGKLYEEAVSTLTGAIKRSLGASHTVTSFVGTMPVSLSRRSLLQLQRTSYYIAEKTDGVRYLMYVIEKPDNVGSSESKGLPLAVLVDRKGAVFNIKGGLAIGEALGLNTVLDGELVYNRSLKTMVFLLFDVLADRNETTTTLPFGERYKVLENQVVKRYKEHMGATEGRAEGTQLVRKIFYKTNELPQLVGKLRTEGGERVFYDSQRRHWKSDGIVFQPDAPYVIAADRNLLKWKWPELRSVDLQARVSEVSGGEEMKYKVELFALGPDGVYIDCTASGTSLAQFDQYRLLADISDRPSVGAATGGTEKPPVVEVVYDTNYGVWRYKIIRTDKKEPNAIATVMGVLMELGESIPIEELEYCFGSSETLTDFTRQVTKMKRQLLDWQTKQQQQKKK